MTERKPDCLLLRMPTEPRVALRHWKDSDLLPYAEMNADPEVMRFFIKALTFEESQAAFLRTRARLDETGWGLWAVDVDGVFAGFTGLAVPTFTAHFTPCVEIGWRLRREFWGQSVGYGAARLAETYAFRTLRLPELVSFTTSSNLRSRRLMERLGLTRKEKDDFMHPLVAADHPLVAHVLYRKAGAAAPAAG